MRALHVPHGGAGWRRRISDPQVTVSLVAAACLLVEAVIATQVVLEALGEALLARLDAGLARHGAGLQRLRRLLRQQQSRHHQCAHEQRDDSFFVHSSTATRMDLNVTRLYVDQRSPIRTASIAGPLTSRTRQKAA